MDLAGSERAANTKNTGVRLIEGENRDRGEGRGGKVRIGTRGKE